MSQSSECGWSANWSAGGRSPRRRPVAGGEAQSAPSTAPQPTDLHWARQAMQHPRLTAAVALSLAVNLLVLLMLGSDLMKVNWTKVKRLFGPRHSGPAPIPYDLNTHIQEFKSSTLVYRDDLGRLLESLGDFHTGVELGVQSGVFSHTMLSTWPSCRSYYLVDLWGRQGNYKDSANVPDEQQEQILLEAQTRLAPYAHKTHWLRMLTPQAASAVPDRLDFVYVDARHDYCGVWVDLEDWWPKIRPGGILAGHDYRGARAVWPHSDWSLCENGTRHPGSVMGAVNTFAMTHGLQVLATWGNAEWSSWIIRKPLAGGACGRLSVAARQYRRKRADRLGRSRIQRTAPRAP